MVRSLRTPGHLALMRVLRETRRGEGLTQAELALRLGRPQSHVAKIEGGERRLDVVEFVEICLALGADPAEILAVIAAAMKGGR